MLSDWMQFLAWAVAVLVLTRAVPAVWQWSRIATAADWQVFVLGSLALAGMRGFNTSALSGVTLHFLGGTIAALLFGPWRACMTMALVSVSGLMWGAAWNGFAADFLLSGVLPIGVTWLGLRWARQVLPVNVFIYVLCNAFGGAALAMAASNLARAGLTAMLGARGAEAYLAATPLLMFGEAFFSGAVLVLVVVYRPHWCASFDDRVYLWPRKPM